MNAKYLNNIELISLNIFSASVIGWLNVVVGYVPTIVSVLVGLSVLALNGIKIYKELKNDKSSN